MKRLNNDEKSNGNDKKRKSSHDGHRSDAQSEDDGSLKRHHKSKLQVCIISNKKYQFPLI